MLRVTANAGFGKVAALGKRRGQRLVQERRRCFMGASTDIYRSRVFGLVHGRGGGHAFVGIVAFCISIIVVTGFVATIGGALIGTTVDGRFIFLWFTASSSFAPPTPGIIRGHRRFFFRKSP
jgi:hypothetical protein